MPSKSPSSVFCRRLREARQQRGLAQDKLGVMIGLDEGCASARMSRYESGIHEPPIATARLIAEALGVSLAYLYCEDDHLAEVLRLYSTMSSDCQQELLNTAVRIATS